MRPKIFLIVTASIFNLTHQAGAADEFEGAVGSSWSGFYVGAFGGVSATETDYDLQTSGASSSPISDNEFRAVNVITAALDRGSDGLFESGAGLIGGVVGYDWQSGPWVYGAYADLAAINVDTQIYTDIFGVQGRYKLGLNYVGTLQAKIGYAFDPALVYLHGGYAYGETEFDFQFTSALALKETYFTDGYVVGVGGELPISQRVSLSADYSFTHLSQTAINGQFDVYEAVLEEKVTLHQLRFGLNFRPFSNGIDGSDQRSVEWEPSWSGFYVGGYTGMAASQLGYDFLITPDVGPDTLSDEDSSIAAAIGNLLGGGVESDGNVSANGAIAGAQIGYDQRYGNLILGAFADITHVGHKTDIRASYDPGEGRSDVGLDYVGTLQARAGFAVNRALLFVHGGYAFGQTSIDLEGEFLPASVSRNQMKHGYVVGAGAEYAVGERLSLVADYSLVKFGKDRLVDGRVSGDTRLQVHKEAELHKVHFGLNYRFGD